MTTPTSPTPEEINEIVRTFGESALEYLLLELPGARIELSKSDTPTTSGGPSYTPRNAQVVSPPHPAAAVDPEETSVATSMAPSEPPSTPVPAVPDSASAATVVVSPAVGVFYRRPSPDSPPFVEVGSVVGPDTPVAILEVMKMFTEVRAGVSGTVAEILVENEDVVEHGQALMRVEP